MAKHTPGPWQAIGTYVSKRKESGYTLPITRVYNQKSGSPGIEPDMDLEEAAANARLIAAAPDLLAALKRLLDERCPFECDADSCECGENGTGFNDAGEPCEHIQACRAIAKATGGRS